jgi:methylmalonyl-CoA mutase N-terminal domain/subunit
VAIQALAAVLGGTQSLHGNGRDEALALPTEEAARIALRTQQIIASESGVANTVDPVGGSWAIEQRTDQIEQDAGDLIRRIDDAGGTLRAIESGRIQRQIQDSAYAAQQAIERGDQVVVGVNRYQTADAGTIALLEIDPETERRQRASVARLRETRDAAGWRAALDAVERAAQDGTNLVPPVIAAVEAQATLGEISDAMRRVFGEHRDLQT